MKKSSYIHKIGTITLGIILILFGSLFLVHIFLPSLSFAFIFKLWPAVFIILGLEILCSKFRQDLEITYDFAAIWLLFFLMLFAAFMGILEIGIEEFPEHLLFYH